MSLNGPMRIHIVVALDMHCRYICTRVPPLSVSRLVSLSVTTPKGAEQPDPWGPTPSHRTNGLGPASRSGTDPVSPRVPEKGALSQNSRGPRTPYAIRTPQRGGNRPPAWGGPEPPRVRRRRHECGREAFLGKTRPPTAFNAGDVKCALPQQSPR